MAYRQENNIQTGFPEIVIDGFENGIGVSPYAGLADVRNMNIDSALGQASVQFATEELTKPPSGYTGVAFSAAASGDVITTASTAGFYHGMALTIVTTSGSIGLTNGRTYYVGDITATTFRLYNDLGVASLIDITSDGTGTFTVPTFGTPIDSTVVYGNSFQTMTSYFNTALGRNFIMCSDGTVWYLRPFIPATGANSLAFMGNTGHSTAGTYNVGIAALGGEGGSIYLFAFMGSAIDYISLEIFGSPNNPSASWVYNWQTTSDTNGMGHKALWATDDALYFCNGAKIGSILIKAGQIFNPANSDTYLYNLNALTLPFWDRAISLAQLGTYLLVGGIGNFIYPWDRVSTSFNYPLTCAERQIISIISTNSNAYVLAGQRGRIYITNGSNIQEYKKIPDSLTGVPEPYFQWEGGMYWKNRLYFGIRALDNNRQPIDDFSGAWVVDLQTGALYMSNSPSHGAYTGRTTLIMQQGNYLTPGDGIYFAWINGATTGVDRTTINPYTEYRAMIETDIIPVGTYLTKNTFNNIEFKLGKPLVSGEKIKISFRTDLNEAYTEIGEVTEAGLLSYVLPLNFQGIQWLQLKVETASTNSSPSYVPLREIRFR